MTLEQENLIRDNMGLVGHMVGRVFGASPRLGCMDYDDLFQIGSIGLCKAAETYSDDGRARFSTYACVVIRNELYKAIEKESHPVVGPLDETLPAPNTTPDHSPLEAITEAMEHMTSAEKRNTHALLLFAEGYSCKQIGKLLKVSDRHAAMLISRARKVLLSKESLLADFTRCA